MQYTTLMEALRRDKDTAGIEALEKIVSEMPAADAEAIKAEGIWSHAYEGPENSLKPGTAVIDVLCPAPLYMGCEFYEVAS